MKIRVAAVGKLKEAYWRAACDEYRKRLARYAEVDVVELPDRSLSRGAEAALATEGADILRALVPGSRVIALDIGGVQRDSKALAAWLERAMVDGVSDVTFVIGGSAGLATSVLEQADERLSLSPMTLPHQLCRVVLLEQVYRAFRIIRGEPYHL